MPPTSSLAPLSKYRFKYSNMAKYATLFETNSSSSLMEDNRPHNSYWTDLGFADGLQGFGHIVA